MLICAAFFSGRVVIYIFFYRSVFSTFVLLAYDVNRIAVYDWQVCHLHQHGVTLTVYFDSDVNSFF